jgi:hypothetical protein
MRKKTKWAVVTDTTYVCAPGSRNLAWTYDRPWAAWVASLLGGRVVDAELFLAQDGCPRDVMAAVDTLGKPLRLPIPNTCSLAG